MMTDAAAAAPSPAAFATGGASSVASSGQKRPADSPAPTMTKQAAAKVINSLVPPKKIKNQSQYVRFKALLLKDAKDRGDTETAGNITKAAKDAWNQVKYLTPPPPVDPVSSSTASAADAAAAASSSTSNVNDARQRHLLLKGRAIKAEADEKAAYAIAVKTFCDAFLEAAISHVQWATIEATEDKAAALKSAIAVVTKKYTAVSWDRDGSSSNTDTAPLLAALSAAQDQLTSFEDSIASKALIAKLKSASDADLAAHAKEHQELLRIKAKYDAIQSRRAAEEATKRQAEEKELGLAHAIESEITSALKKQMVYTNSSLKYSSKKISYKRGGVTPKVFARAFGVPEGTKKATIEGYLVGSKSLRYGAHLSCSDVTVKLVGEELTATASYSM